MKREVHKALLKGLFRVGPYLTTEPLSIVDCVSYDYVPALLDSGFRFEATGRIYDAFYYWKPVFAKDAELPTAVNRRGMTAAYQNVKEKRDRQRHYAISVNDRFWYLIAKRKIWVLKKSISNNGMWKSLRNGDVIFFIRARRFLRGYGIVENTYSNNEDGLQDFPLGIRFRQVIETPEIDLSFEMAKSLQDQGWGGIFDVNLEFASLALQEARKSRGGSRMWVTPNPLLIAETDIETVENEIFVVMPWEHRQSIFKTIKAVCETQNYLATYAAETGGQVVMEDIWRLLNRARAVIIDFTGSRPNVYLEFGMAIVLGKPIIAITQNQDDCPSDVRNIKYIVYSKDHADHILEKELPKALRDTINQVEKMAAKRNTQSW